ncbi:uncharacterized protein LOC115220304 [Argonauta hians]
MFPVLSQLMEGDRDTVRQVWGAWHTNALPVVLSAPDTMSVRPLLFQCAISYAHEGNHVTYICQDSFTHLPVTVHGMPKASATVLGMVKFMYVKELEELYEFCASVHLSHICPQVIIVEDIYCYIHQSKRAQSKEEVEVAKLCAMLVDALHYCHTSWSSAEMVPQLLISCQQTNHLLSVFQKLNFQIISSKVTGGDRTQPRLVMKTAANDTICITYSVDLAEEIRLNNIKCLERC